MRIKRKHILLALLAVPLVWLLADALLQPGTKNLRGGFTELAFIRNAQNTGPVVRIYAVSVTDALWKEMEQYGNYMPYNKYGLTRVYFFRPGMRQKPQLFLEGDNIDSALKKECIARYEKNAMSQVYLSRYPFR